MKSKQNMLSSDIYTTGVKTTQVTTAGQGAKMYCKLIIKSPRFVTFGAHTETPGAEVPQC